MSRPAEVLPGRSRVLAVLCPEPSLSCNGASSSLGVFPELYREGNKVL